MAWSGRQRPNGGWGRWLATATGYPLALGAVCLTVARQPDAVQGAWRGWASTDLANLADHPVAALVVSTFLPEHHFLGWVAVAAVGLGAAGWVLGFVRTTVLVAVSHLVGTLVSEGILAELIRRGDRPASARHLLDVGPSYLVVSALVVGIGYGPWRVRAPAAGAFAVLAPNLFGGIGNLEVAPVGHVCAVVVGVVGGGLLSPRAPLKRRPPAAAEAGRTGAVPSG